MKLPTVVSARGFAPQAARRSFDLPGFLRRPLLSLLRTRLRKVLESADPRFMNGGGSHIEEALLAEALLADAALALRQPPRDEKEGADTAPR